jgi:hypothetical protein
MPYDFVIITQPYQVWIKAESGGAKIWAMDNWRDTMKVVDKSAEGRTTAYLRSLGFTVGPKT